MIVNHTIDNIRTSDMSKIYCKCGNIVSLDKGHVRMKKHLNKKVECTMCRNHRISFETEYLNALFNGTLDEESMA
jgi:hypothetical protein